MEKALMLYGAKVFQRFTEVCIQLRPNGSRNGD